MEFEIPVDVLLCCSDAGHAQHAPTWLCADCDGDGSDVGGNQAANFCRWTDNVTRYPRDSKMRSKRSVETSSIFRLRIEVIRVLEVLTALATFV